MGSSLSNRSRRAVTVATIGTISIVATAITVAVVDDRAGRPSLIALGWLVGVAGRFGGVLLERPAAALAAAGAVLASLLVVAALEQARRASALPSHATWLLSSAALAVTGQLLIVQRRLPAGLLLLGLGAIAAAVAGRRSLDATDPGRPPSPPAWSMTESFQLLAILVGAAVFRFFALNRVVEYFEGELSPYMVGASDVPGMLYANAGNNGPWAPLGLLYYLPMYLTVAIAGTTVLAVRLAPAAIGVVTVAAAYLLARTVAGRGAGLLAAGLLTLDPLQIGWARSDVHPHGETAWPALLLGWATLQMLSKRSTGWCLAVAALMGLSWHQYPSGQVAVAVPLVAVAVHAAVDRRLLRDLGWRVGLLVGGLLLWFGGFPLAQWLGLGKLQGFRDYVASLGTRVASAEPGGSALAPAELGHLVGNAADLVVGAVVELPRLFHQTFIPEITGLPLRSLPWFVAAFAVVGVAMLAARLPASHSVVLLALTATSAVPAVFSDVAYVKRAAVLYPVLEVIAAVAMVATARSVVRRFRRVGRPLVATTLAVGLTTWVAICAHLWFSGRHYRWGTPPEQAIAEAVTAELQPHTLVLAGFWDFYMDGKFTYLLLDELRRPEIQPVAWFLTRTDRPIWHRLAERPTDVIAALEGRPWLELWSGLDRQLPALPAVIDWQRVVYLIQEDDDLAYQIERIRGSCPTLEVRTLAPGTDPKHRMRLAVCEDHAWLRAVP
jgi:hypothetical protein